MTISGSYKEKFFLIWYIFFRIPFRSKTWKHICKTFSYFPVTSEVHQRRETTSNFSDYRWYYWSHRAHHIRI